jgi:RND family efflux transporter MFP subunit
VSQQQADEALAAFTAAQAQHQAATAGVTRAESRIAQSRASTLSARAALEFTRVRAPFDGVVLARPAQVGDLAAPGVPLYIVEQDGGRRVEVALPESLSQSVSLGQSVAVQVDGEGGNVTGTVGEISPLVDAAARAFSVKVDLPPEASHLRPGMFARVSFERPAHAALTVPASAVTARGSLDRVFVVEDGVAQLRLVTLGAGHGERVVVLSGVSPGEVVVTDPPSVLRDRDRVEVSQ